MHRTVTTALLISFTTLTLISCAKSPAGTYMADSRPREILYMTLAQAQDRLNGNFSVVSPNGRGGIENTTFSLEGLNGKDNFTLTAKEPGFFGKTLLLSGHKEGNKLLVTIPTPNGVPTTITLSPSTEASVNTTLTTWQAEISASYTKLRELQAEQDFERNEFNKLTSALNEEIRGIKQTGIPQDAANAKAALLAENKGIQKIRQSSDKLKSDAAVRPMTCYQAEQRVRYDFEQGMQYHWEQSFKYGREQLARSITALRSRIEYGEKAISKLSILSENSRRFSENYPSRQPAINQQLAQAAPAKSQYIALLDTTKKDIKSWESEDTENVALATQLMKEGRSITDTTLRNTTCP